MIVIGLSGKARHGKGSVVQLAQILLQKGDNELEVRQVSFAAALKEMANMIVEMMGDEMIFVRDVLSDWGLPPEMVADVMGLAKDLTLQDLKEKTPKGRKFLQFIGTEAFRKNVDDLFWVKRAAEAIAALPPETKIVFVPDCRFPNEADYVRGTMGGKVWRIERYVKVKDYWEPSNFNLISYDNGLSPEAKAHPSETALDDYKFDAVLKATNMEDLFNAVKSQLARLGFS